MTKEELKYIKDSFSQILDDIAGNPEWYEASRAIASELGSLERELEKKVVELPSGLDEAAEEWAKTTSVKVWGEIDPKKDLKGYMARANYGVGLSDGFKAGAEWMAEQYELVHDENCAVPDERGGYWPTQIKLYRKKEE